MDLKARTIVITGGFGVLGAAAAEAASAAGARPVLVDFAARASGAQAPRLAADALLLGGVDLTDPGKAEQAMAAAAETTGRIDALLNIAGGFSWQTLQDGGIDPWDRLYAMNVKTAAVASRAALPWLLKADGRGAIVNVGAAAALKSGMGMGAYAASKAGVARLTESLAEEMKGRVRVNAVLPSIIDTPQNRKDMPDADPATWVAPGDLAAVMLFLASDAARAVTGALVPVTGLV